jgi:hypothetical protein
MFEAEKRRLEVLEAQLKRLEASTNGSKEAEEIEWTVCGNFWGPEERVSLKTKINLIADYLGVHFDVVKEHAEVVKEPRAARVAKHRRHRKHRKLGRPKLR